MTNFKRFLFLFAIVSLAAGLSVGTMAACSPGVTVTNTWGWQQNVSGTPGTDIICNFWEVGNAAVNNSGTLAQSLYVTAYSTGFYVTSSWGNTGVVGCPGTPPPGTSRTAFLYSIANGGTGQYLILSTAYNATKGYYWFDDITNGTAGPNVCDPVAIPTLTITNSVPVTGGYDITISWTAIANLKGYYDAAPTNNIITGVAARYSTNTADSSTASWTLASGGPNSQPGYVSWGTAGTDPGTMTVFIPGPIASTTYLALSVLFDGQTATVPNPGKGKALGLMETAFVGAPSAAIGPTAAGVFSAFAADKTSQGQLELSWRSNVEDGVAYYQAYASSSRNGSYLPIEGTKVNTLGNNHVYSVKVPMPRTFSTSAIYVKIKAAKMSGSDSWSDVMAVNTGITPPTSGTGATTNQGGQR